MRLPNLSANDRCCPQHRCVLVSLNHRLDGLYIGGSPYAERCNKHVELCIYTGSEVSRFAFYRCYGADFNYWHWRLSLETAKICDFTKSGSILINSMMFLFNSTFDVIDKWKIIKFDVGLHDLTLHRLTIVLCFSCCASYLCHIFDEAQNAHHHIAWNI